MHSLFLITSRSSFITDAERAVTIAADTRITGSAAPSEGGAATVAEAVRSGAASAILLDLDSGLDDALRTLREVCVSHPGTQVLVASCDRDPDLILQAIRVGAADFLTLPLDCQALTDALSRMGRFVPAQGAPVETQQAEPGRVMAFVGSKGGCGTTTVAVNVGVGLCQRPPEGRSVILLDLDTPGGDVTAMLKLKPSYTLADVVDNIHRLDMDLLNSMVLRHESGLQVLAAAGEGQNRMVLDPETVGTIVGFLRNHYDDVLLAGHARTDQDMLAASQAHIVHLVTAIDYLSLKRAQSTIHRMREIGVEDDALRVIVNKHDKNSDITLGDARKAIAAPIVLSVPNDVRAAERAINEGIPVVHKGKGKMQAMFHEYAVQLTSVEENNPGRNHGVGRLIRRLVPGRA